jgi:hypothetical protein
MKQYIAIFVENIVGEWRVVFSDLLGCEVRGFNLDDAQYAAASGLDRCIQESRSPLPAPMDLGEQRGFPAGSQLADPIGSNGHQYQCDFAV